MKGPNGKMQMVGHNRLWVSQKGVAFNMQGPSPFACRHCGGRYWERFCPILQQRQAARGVHGQQTPHAPGQMGTRQPQGMSTIKQQWGQQAQGRGQLPQPLDNRPCLEETSETVAMPSSASRESTENRDYNRACRVPRGAQESRDVEGNASSRYKRSESPPWCSSRHPLKTTRRDHCSWQYADLKPDLGQHTGRHPEHSSTDVTAQRA